MDTDGGTRRAEVLRGWSTGRRVIVAAAVLVVAGLAAVLVIGGSSSSGGGSKQVAVDGGTKVVVPAGERREPVELSGTTLKGERLDLATLRGKPVVLNIWGSWCPPCRKEAPDLRDAATELEGKAEFVGIAVRDEAGQALAYERKYKVNYPSLLDTGDLLLSLRGAVSAQSPPVTLVLDEQGRVAARFVGPVTRRTVVAMVSDVAAA